MMTGVRNSSTNIYLQNADDELVTRALRAGLGCEWIFFQADFQRVKVDAASYIFVG